MCGIAGFWSEAVPLPTMASRMADTLAHRGPDHTGRWIDEAAGLALAYRRLSILDLSPAGHQPMISASGRLVIVLNGEIYNHAVLRRDLEFAGHAAAWRGHSDTEVLLAGFEAWGVPGTLGKSLGMFALALWDRETRTLTLARDRLGEKPLYYGWQDGVLLFGSELKALKAHPAFRGDIDRDALALFVRHSNVPAPYSIYRGIYKLPPGCYLTVTPHNRAGECAEPVVYWSAREVVENGQAHPFTETEEDAREELERLLRQSIAAQMLADVPLGALLSGGIDSSTVVALMQAQSTRPVKTFTVGFHEEGYSEAEHARAVARHLGCDHTELYVTPGKARAVIPLLPQIYDEPFSDSSQIPTCLVARLAREQVTVSLSGDGGDELFGGYDRYSRGKRAWRRLAWAPHSMRAALAGAVTRLSPAAWDRMFNGVTKVLPGRFGRANVGAKLHRLADRAAVRSPEEVYRGFVSHWKEPPSLVQGAEEPPPAITAGDRWARLGDFEHRMMYLDTVSYLPDDILVKLDRAAMAVSLETRVPLLDRRVVEFAWRLPLSMKIRGGKGKWLLRQVLHRYVPQGLVDRPKMGFAAPIGAWLRGPLREWAESLLDEKRLREEGYFDVARIRSKWAEHLAGPRNRAYDLWDVLMFEAWYESQKAWP